MAQVEAPVFWFLFEPKGIAGDAIVSATADRSNLSEPTIGFKLKGGTLVLHISQPEMPDQWALRPIKFFPEVVCVHLPFVLIRIHSTNSKRFPTSFRVFRFSFQKGASHTVTKLPKIASEIWASQSFGLVYDRSDCNTYIVANLQREYNKDTKQVEVFLHRWWCSGSSWQSKLNEKVTLPFGINIDMGKWQCDQVVTFMNDLLWVDLSQGVILRCKNPLKKCEANFDFIRLPCMKRVQRPQTFMSVGCCNGKLKLVEIDDTSDVNTVCVDIKKNTVCVTIMTFNEESYKICLNKWLSWKYWDKNFPICIDPWAAMKNMPALQLLSSSEASGYHMPCFPVLSSYNDNIFHLIMARKDNTDAWLLQVNTQSRDLEAAAAYPAFSNHQKPLYSSYFHSLPTK